jgi:hypothetical protein
MLGSIAAISAVKTVLSAGERLSVLLLRRAAIKSLQADAATGDLSYTEITLAGTSEEVNAITSLPLFQELALKGRIAVETGMATQNGALKGDYLRGKLVLHRMPLCSTSQKVAELLGHPGVVRATALASQVVAL